MKGRSDNRRANTKWLWWQSAGSENTWKMLQPRKLTFQP